ncbi:proteasome subunit alpha [Phytomonospora sp. NPDC050363]|uniref:proteasome subunit alpha n=1 Tax=Phytomonospora sp. NPDC050363 TaxID=3155642 RepID=UPI0033CCFA5B
MAMQFYTSPEQIMRDRSEYARKGIARGRSVVVLSFAGGVLFVAENLSTALHKISEIYDRIGFAAVGRYNEFENLRAAGVRMADLRGYAYDRRDVTAWPLANVFAQNLGAIFTESTKPFEVEVCVAGVGATPEDDELYRLTYDGSINDEPGFVAMGGQSEQIGTKVRESHRVEADLEEALRLAVRALGSIGGDGGAQRELKADQLEVAVLDRGRPGRSFRRIRGAALEALLLPSAEVGAEVVEPVDPQTPESDSPADPQPPAVAKDIVDVELPSDEDGDGKKA